MKDSVVKLSERLSKNLHPVYIISGDEILLVEEAFDPFVRQQRDKGSKNESYLNQN